MSSRRVQPRQVKQALHAAAQPPAGTLRQEPAAKTYHRMQHGCDSGRAPAMAAASWPAKPSRSSRVSSVPSRRVHLRHRAVEPRRHEAAGEGQGRGGQGRRRARQRGRRAVMACDARPADARPAKGWPQAPPCHPPHPQLLGCLAGGALPARHQPSRRSCRRGRQLGACRPVLLEVGDQVLPSHAERGG